MNDQAFLKAVAGGDAETVREMVRRDPSLARSRDERGVSALLVALYHGHAEVAEALAGARDDLDVFEAAAAGRAERVRELVAADPTLANRFASDGFPPLGLAVFFGRGDAVEALLEAGADPNLASDNAMRVRPLHAAAAAGRVDLARLLVERGADLNARQQAGFVPLHEAANAGNLELAQLLVDAGADVDAATDDGRTPLAIARDRNHDDVAAYLEAVAGRR
jgi:uncharacterized protein